MINLTKNHEILVHYNTRIVISLRYKNKNWTTNNENIFQNILFIRPMDLPKTIHLQNKLYTYIHNMMYMIMI